MRFKPRLGACRNCAPSLPVPMVFLMRNYVRVVRVSPLGLGRGGGRIATRAQTVPGGLVADYSERV